MNWSLSTIRVCRVACRCVGLLHLVCVLGEQVYVNLYGVAQDINVRLEKKSIHFENTYLEMINQRTVTLSNRSDQLVHFQWKQYSNEREEEQQKLRQLHALSDEEVNALQKLSSTSTELFSCLRTITLLFSF